MRMRCRAVLFVASAIWLVPSAGVLAHVDVTPAEARELIDSTDDLLVVDVREPFEYCDERGHIPGAVNYPLTSGVLYARYEELPMDRPILVVCRSGGRSNVAATFLDDQGFSEVYDMTGGMNAWLWETAPCKYAGGSGTAEDPYQIATAADLIALGATPEDYDKHFILTADIDLDPSLPGGQVFAGALIAPDMSTSNNFQGTAFSGTFDGNGYRIANLTIDAGTGEYLGLFGSVTGMAVIDGVTLENVVVTGRKYVSGLIGYNVGTVSDCRVSCRLQGAGFAPWRFGGLVAFNVGSIHNCQVTGEIFTLDSSGYFGGLVGWNEGPIANSRAHVDIAGGEGCWEIGGLVGENRAPVTNCHAAGNVTGGDRCRFLGGLAGVNYDTILTNCSATGDVSAGARSNRMAGLVGGNPNATIVFCYATGDVTAGDSGSELGGLAGDNFGTITDCWAGGAISLGLNGLSAGGLIGYHGGSAANSYVTGAVSAGEEARYVGALIGRGSGRVDGCFWDEETSGPIGNAGGQGRTTSQMQTASTFLEAGWDFVDETENGAEDIWRIVEGQTYPLLFWQKYGGGTGEPNDPYQIFTAEHLNAIGAEPNDYEKHFRLMADIDLSDYVYDRAVIAPDTDDTEDLFQGTPFTGVFDGNGHAISPLVIRGANFLGLFGELDSEAVVVGLCLRAVDVNGAGVCVGGLTGQNRGSIRESCSCGVISGFERVGGLVGNNIGTVAQCHTTASVNGVSIVGGLIGSSYTDRGIRHCYAMGSVVGDWTVGGLVGQSGFVGPGRRRLEGTVVGCYSSASVAGGGAGGVGGLVGEYFGEISNSFWDTQTSDQVISAAGTGLTTVEMQTASTFLDAGWDFTGEAENGVEEIWWIEEGRDYPRLWWERDDTSL